MIASWTTMVASMMLCCADDVALSDASTQDASAEATIDADAEDVQDAKCDVTYESEASTPCDGPNPCWRWQTSTGTYLPKGSPCPFDCICATPTTVFGQPILCGCSGACHHGGCIEP